MHPYNFGASGNILMKLFKACPLKVVGQKTSKFRLDFWQLSTLIANISETGRHIEYLKSSWWTTAPPALDRRTPWTLVHIRKSYGGAYWPTQVDIFRDTIYRPLKGAASSNFYTRYRLTKSCWRTPPRGRRSPKNVNRENLKFGLKFSVWASIIFGV